MATGRGVLVLLLTTALLMVAGPSRADEVYLKNGDRLSGTVVRMDKGVLVLETSYAGQIQIDWHEVARLSSKAAVGVTLGDGTRLVGKIGPAADGSFKLDSEGLRAPVVLNLDSVEAIGPTKTPPVKITATANAGVSVQDGNTRAQNYHLDGELTARTANTRYRAGGEWNEEKADRVDTAKNWLAYADYRYFLAPKWFMFANTRFQNDEFADLRLRTTLGGGSGYQFYESPDLNMSFQVGLSYVDENFYIAADDSFPAAQWEFNYEQFFFNKTLELFHHNTGYWSLKNVRDWIVQTRQGLRHPIYKGLTATLQYNYDYNNHPSPDADTDWDWKLLFLLGYRFGN